MNDRVRFQSIQQRLIVGFGLLVGLFCAAGLAGRATIARMSDVIGETLVAVQENAQRSAQLSAAVTQELAFAQRAVENRDFFSRKEMGRFGAEARRVQIAMKGDTTASTRQRLLADSIELRLAGIEAGYTHALQLSDGGRRDEALRAAEDARAQVPALLEDVRQFTVLKASAVDVASRALRRDLERRGTWVLAIMAVAVILGLAVVASTISWIVRPMRRLADQARALSSGDFSQHTDAELPREFRELAEAMNATASSLSRVVSVTTSTADDVSSSARDLANVSEQISASASQMAASMTEISSGAESQVRQLRAIDDALRAIRGNADEMLAGAGEVSTLAGDIESSARAKRAEIARSLGILTTVRQTVREAATQVNALNETAADINRLVATVGRIAEQTDLLALNAAIEAARAGAAGRGFGVVADEVRKLAEQAQAAADDVVALTRTVTARVGATTRAMETGVSHVDEIEGVSRDVDGALTSITEAAERTREAAGSTADKAERNANIVASAAKSVQSVAKTAEGYAAAAQEVSASTQEQSAACEQMSSASTQLLQGSVQLRTLVGGLASREEML